MQKALQLVWVVLFKMWHPWITLDCELYQKRKFHYLECQLSTSQWSGIIPTWITFLGDSVLSPRYFNTFFDIWIMNLHGLFSLIVKTKELQLLELHNRTPSSYPSAPTATYKYTIVWLEYFLHSIILKVLRVSLKPVRYYVFWQLISLGGGCFSDIFWQMV